MALKFLPFTFADAATGFRRIAETINGILNFQFDDSRIRTPAERAAGVTPVNYAYAPGIAIDPHRYNMKADGSANDTTAYTTALAVAAQTGGFVQLPAGTILLSPGIAHPANVLVRGAGNGQTLIKRAATGDFITSFGVNASLQDLTIDMQGVGLGAGIGLHILANAGAQFLSNVSIINAAGACLQFEAVGGSNSVVSGGVFFTLGTMGSVGAIKINGDDSQAVPRTFLGVNSDGCTLYDFGGASDLFVYGGYTNGLIFSSANASNVCLNGLRVGAAGGAVTVKGGGHQFNGVQMASPSLTLDSTCLNGRFNLTIGDYAITDNGTGNSVWIPTQNYVPSWTTTGTAPALGNGSINGKWSRDGSTISVDVDLTMGSTTTYGTGDFHFSLPFAANALAHGNQRTAGSALLNDSSSGIFDVGCSVVDPSGVVTSIFAQGQTTAVAATVPFTWATGDRITLHVEYKVP